MTFKRLLSIVDVRQSDEDLKTAINLCAEIEAQLSVLVVAIALPPPMGAYPVGTGDIWVAERNEDLVALGRRVQDIEALTAKAGISATVNDEYPEAARFRHVIGRYARYSDATIIGSDLIGNESLKADAIEGALFESGKPILIVPRGSKPTLRPKSVLLAWDSGVECTRAAREALHLMSDARDVHVTLVDPDASSIGNGPEPGAEIASYLAHHGIRVAVDCLPSGGDAIADVIKRHATDVAADLIVMGGYGHSRIREWIFGSVTKSMLDEPIMPVFMAR